MAVYNIFKKNLITVSHLPSAFIAIGYLSYWIELYFIKLSRGRTSLLALILFIACSLAVIFYKKEHLYRGINYLKQVFLHKATMEKIIFIASLIIIIMITMTIFLALLLPPHLCQESDSLNYHITLPRQHLIQGTFKHLNWSAADLRTLPLEFAFAPYWFFTRLPNKYPQILFVIGLALVAMNMVKKIRTNNAASSMVVAMAIFGSHALGIQMGTAMFDLISCYLFIASLDSLLSKRFILCAIEFTFFFWSKPFYPLHTGLVIITLMALIYIFKALGKHKISWGFKNGSLSQIDITPKEFQKIVVYILFFSILIAGPFVVKSIYYAGTPLFPFLPGIFNLSHLDKASSHWQSIISVSKLSLSMKDAYGSGRSILDFIRHLWILAVPEEGVMNRYDYPLGLPYLLFLGPFLYMLIKSFRAKTIAILPLFAVIYWLIWWFSSQQSRFLFIPLVLIFIVVSAEIGKPTNVFLFSLLLALALNFISIFRAHYRDILRLPEQVLRDKDRKLLVMGEEYYAQKRQDMAVLDNFDVAYADFPVKVAYSDKVRESDYWVLKD